jgi:FkbM family methyltransferase
MVVGSMQEQPSEPHFVTSGEFPMRLRALRWLGHQGWMRSWIRRGRDQLFKVLYEPFANHSYLFEIDYFGQRYRGDLVRSVDWAAFCYGSAAHSELGLLGAATTYLRARRPGPVNFFDVGANVGHHTLFMTRLAERVIAFEPFPDVLKLFRDHVSLNHLTNVEIVPVALGEKDDSLAFYPGSHEENTIGTFLASNAPQRGVSCDLPVRNGDALFDREQYPEMHILKVDVEGFEPFVLRGLRKRIRRDRPIILSEMLDFTRSSYGSESQFRECFYENAVFANVMCRNGSFAFTLRPFDFYHNGEVLTVPAEMADFVNSRIAHGI